MPLETPYVRIGLRDLKISAAAESLANAYDLTKEARELFSLVHPHIPKGATVWVYLRHVAALQPLPVWVFPASEVDGKLVEQALTQRWKLGVLPLVLTLDALIPGSARPLGDGSCFSIEAHLGAQLAHGDFAAAPKVGTASAKLSGSRVCIELADKHTTQYRVNGRGEDAPSFPNESDITPDGLKTKLLNGRSLPIMACAPAVAHICSQMHIDHGMLAYRALYASLLEMVLNCRSPLQLGSVVTAMVARPGAAFGAVAGLMVYSAAALTETQRAGCEAALDQAQKRWRQDKDLSGKGFQKPPVSVESQVVPEEVMDAVLRAMGRSRPQGSKGMTDTAYCSTHHFLDLALQLRDEYIEGRPTKFGLVMGNPFLTRFWPGQLPTPIAVPRYGGGLLGGQSGRVFEGYGLTVEELAQFNHVAASPWHRCIVVPYGAPVRPDGGANTMEIRVPLFTVGLQDLRLGLSEWDEGVLWSSTGGIYAFMTRLLPWSCACIVGPGSKLRVYAGGKMVASKDGKGWRFLDGGEDLVELVLERDGEAVASVLREAIRVALQVSPSIRPAMHGGFFLYARSQEQLGRAVALQALQPPLIHRLDGNEWIQGRRLLESRGKINVTNAERLIRAAMVDGAVVLADDLGEVKGYAQRVVPRDESGQVVHAAGGSKRATARHFVEKAGDGAFAIAVSSDGPVRVYHREFPEGREVFPMANSDKSGWRR